MDEEEQRILEHIQRTYPAEFVEKGMQVLKEIVLRRTRSQIELDARLIRMQAEALHPINNPAWGTSSSSGGPPPTAQVVSLAATSSEDEEVPPPGDADEEEDDAEES